jgi:predicted phosphohydrolase
VSSIFVTGDIHGDPMERLSSQNFPTGKTLTKDDIVIVAGDFGIIFCDHIKYEYREQYLLKWLRDKPWTTLFVGGNHENWDKLRNLPLVEKFDSKLGKVNDSVYFIPNGSLLTINGKTFWCMGGAMSTDIAYRINYQNKTREKIWWEEEIPTRQEMDRGVRLLESVDCKVDYIITHTMPTECVEEFSRKYLFYYDRQVDPTARYLQFIVNELKPTFREWYCGHFHKNEKYLYVDCIMDAIYELYDPKDEEGFEDGN